MPSVCGVAVHVLADVDVVVTVVVELYTGRALETSCEWKRVG